MQYCVILGGGKSSRMGRDKTLLPFGEFATLAHYQFAKYSQIFDTVFLVAKEAKFEPPLPLIADKFSDFSPMQAIYSALSYFEKGKIFIIAADMPLVKEETVKKLFDYSKDLQICVAQDEVHTHSLCGFFDVNIANIACKLHSEGIHKVQELFKKVKFDTVKFDDIKQFANINNPKDYDTVLKSINL